MEFSTTLHIIKTRQSIVNIEGLQVIISKIYFFLSLMINFVLVNSADPDEMLLYAAFHLGLHCLLKYPFRGFQSTKGLNIACSTSNTGLQETEHYQEPSLLQNTK